VPPGRHTVEVVAYDAQAATAGVDRLTLVAPAPRDALRLSSLVGCRPRGAARPGRVRTAPVAGHLYPTFGEAVSAGAGKPLAFVFTARPGPRPAGEATVELVRETDTLRRAGVLLPAPDPTGEVRVVGGLPLDGIVAGE